MNDTSLLFVDPPDLSDENAHEMLNFLNDIVTAFEQHYRHQLLRYQPTDLPEHQLWDSFDFDDKTPPF